MRARHATGSPTSMPKIPIVKLIALGVALSGCSTYQWAKDVKYVSFDGNLAPGTGVGPVQGESCQTYILGYAVNEAPTLDKAVQDARKQSKLRYMTDMATDVNGFNAVVYGKSCLIVKGTGYQ